MKNKDLQQYQSLIDKIDSLEETIEELKIKLNNMTLLWHNNAQKQPTSHDNKFEDNK